MTETKLAAVTQAYKLALSEVAYNDPPLVVDSVMTVAAAVSAAILMAVAQKEGREVSEAEFDSLMILFRDSVRKLLPANLASRSEAH
jgi:hypothetical protein